MRQTVRDRLQAIYQSKAAIASFALAIVVIIIIASAVVTGSRDDQEMPVAGATSTVVRPLPSEPSDGDEDRVEGPRSRIVATVAGFGLLGAWVLGGGIVLTRAHRHQNRTPQQDASTMHHSR